MRLSLKLALAAAAFSIATPAVAQQVTATDQTTGTPLTETIHKSTSNTPEGTADNVGVVYGSTTQPGWNSTNVKFIGGNIPGDSASFFAGDTNAPDEEGVHEVEHSGGYAALSNATGATGLLWSLIINPDELFTDMKFSVQLDGAGSFDLWYLLAGDTWSNLDKDGNAIHFVATNPANTNYLIDVTGGMFDAIEIAAYDPPGGTGSLFEVKQISMNPAAAVPEPATWALMLLGFGCIGWRIGRRNRKSIPQLA